MSLTYTKSGLWFSAVSSRGWSGWLLAFILTAFYVCIYWFPSILGYHEKGLNYGLIGLFDGFSRLMNGKAATQWFVYGFFYTVFVIGFGVKFILKYRHSRYQVIRTLSVMFFQLGFAFLIPELLSKLQAPETAYFGKNMVNMWPLNYYFFEEWHIKNMLSGGNLGLFMLLLGIAMIFVISPILTFFYGKRWYCSWVCGCGGLAETAGDSFRHLSDKTEFAWKIEHWLIHSMLVFIYVTTVAVIYTFLKNEPNYIISKDAFVYGTAAFTAIIIGLLYLYKRKDMDKDAVFTMSALGIALVVIILINKLSGAGHIFFIDSYSLRSWYGFFIGAAFSGVIGVGFYPILGSRIWCRFGCPMAAILGLQQRLFSRFRITTNGGQCISCGNCSNVCEMGIDVRAYAQKGENIVRASCVGCGLCSEVCPRGVLKLENGPLDGRINESEAMPIGNDLNLIDILMNKK